MSSSAERDEIRQLCAALKRVEMERTILRSLPSECPSRIIPTASAKSRDTFVAACIELWPVQLLCQVLGVSPAGYYQ